MYVLTVLSVPFGRSAFGRKLNALFVLLQVRFAMLLTGVKNPLIYVGCPPAFEVAKKLKHRGIIYERTDIFEEMPGVDGPYIASLDDQLVKNACLSLYVNTALHKHGAAKNANSLLIGHGVDYDLFADSKNGQQPNDIESIRGPIIGFFGDVSGKTSDLKLLEHIARSLPEMSLVFVGPVSADVTRLKQYSNVHFLGQKPYIEIPSYGRAFDVAIMPWNQNRWIEFCNPVKMKEYLALGKPVVTTYYPEVEPYSDVVYVAKDYDDFVDCIRKAVTENDLSLQQQRREKVQNETWDSKAGIIKAFIEEHIN
jgi:glycosyltransferase involved in cell wall biosynthesis